MPQDIEIKGLAELQADFKRLPGAVRKEILFAAVEDGSNIIQGAEIAEAPKKTGKLAAGITIKAGRNQTANQASMMVGPTSPYALFVHQGTKPHEIRPKNAKALFWEGARHPVRHVKHPGTRPQPFVDQAVASKGPEAAKRMMATIWEGIRGIMQR